METFALLLAPMAPHVAEELWSLLGREKSLAHERWPEYDPVLLKDDEVEIPVQLNGKLRGRVVVAAGARPPTSSRPPAPIPRLPRCSKASRSARW